MNELVHVSFHQRIKNVKPTKRVSHTISQLINHRNFRAKRRLQYLISGREYVAKFEGLAVVSLDKFNKFQRQAANLKTPVNYKYRQLGVFVIVNST